MHGQTGHGAQDPPEIEAILRSRDSPTKETEYFVKYLHRKYAESKWVPKSEILSHPDGKALINRFSKRGRSENSNRNYDPMFDKVDSIVLDSDGRYLVLWCKLGFEDPTWETKVDDSAVKLYNSRKDAGFSLRSDDVTRPPNTNVPLITSFEHLTPREATTLNRLLKAYKQEKDIIVTDAMNFQSVRAGVALLQVLQQSGDHGPFLIVTDNIQRWTEHLRACPELLTLVYGGSDEARERIQNWFFDDSSDQLRFHVIVSSVADAFGRGVNLLSKVHYRVAIFNMPNAKQMYKSFGQLLVGRYICMAGSDAGHYAKEFSALAEVCSLKDLEGEIPPEAIRRAREASAAIQPALQRLNKHGDANFVCPPTQTINCPLSRDQKVLCQQALSKFKENPRVAAEKVLRVCSHAFLVEGGEFALRGTDFLAASTKLMVLDCLLAKFQQESLSVLIIAQFSKNVDLIVDLLGTRDITFYHYSNLYEEQLSQAEHLVSIFNPRFSKGNVHMEQFNCVIIFDGATAAWKEMVNDHRRSRAPSFNVTQVYSLECRDCCERELLSACVSSSFNEKRAEQACRAAAVHAYSSFVVDEPEELIKNCEVLDEQLFTQPILQFLQDGDEDFWQLFTFDESVLNHDEPIKEESTHLWTVHERNQLVRGLFRFGFGRWTQIQQTCGLFVHKDAIHSAAKAVISDLLRVASNATGYATARQFVASIDEKETEDSQSFIDSSCFGSEFFLGLLRKVANPLLKRLEFLFYLDSSLGGETTVSEIPTFRLGGALLTEWWTEDYDKALVYVTWKFGFGVYDHVAENLDDRLCTLLLTFPEVMDEKRLQERALRLCEVAKRTPMSDERVIRNLMDRPCAWPKQDQEKAISTILRFGIQLDKDGVKDYAWFKQTAGLNDRSEAEVAEYVDELLKHCQNPGSENTISYDTAMRVTQRAGAMRQLREVLQQPEEKLMEIFTSLPHWRNLPRKWTPELELYYFQMIETRGFGSYEEILADDDFRDVFENGTPASFLLANDAVIKRINAIFYYMNHRPAPKPPKKKSSSSSAPAKKITGVSIKDLNGGNVTYPVAVTQTSQILDIGHVVSDRPGFHSERYIYPAGYRATRLYSSLRNPEERVVWISEIVDTGKKGPLFRVYQEEDPAKKFEGDTPSSPWVQILKAVAAVKREKRANTISGPEAYLLASPITSYLIQHLPGARDCEKYKWRPIDGE